MSGSSRREVVATSVLLSFAMVNVTGITCSATVDDGEGCVCRRFRRCSSRGHAGRQEVAGLPVRTLRRRVARERAVEHLRHACWPCVGTSGRARTHGSRHEAGRTTQILGPPLPTVRQRRPRSQFASARPSARQPRVVVQGISGTHPPSAHLWSVAQTVPQRPQFARSVRVSAVHFGDGMMGTSYSPETGGVPPSLHAAAHTSAARINPFLYRDLLVAARWRPATGGLYGASHIFKQGRRVQRGACEEGWEPAFPSMALDIGW